MKGKTILMGAAVLFVVSACPFHLASQQAVAATTPAARPAEVPNGTQFLIGLQDKLSTRKDKPGKRFKAKTLEPLGAADGTILKPGAEVRGHISRVEPAGLTGRARLWISLDDIKTPAGRMPLIAEVIEVPGEHSVKAGPSQEGEIEARTSKGTRDLEAAAAGAAIGAAAGAAAKGGRGAAVGAAVGAAGGFLISSGYAQELELQKGTKIELQLTRPLYMAQR